jgi:hypothetical protein
MKVYALSADTDPPVNPVESLAMLKSASQQLDLLHVTAPPVAMCTTAGLNPVDDASILIDLGNEPGPPLVAVVRVPVGTPVVITPEEVVFDGSKALPPSEEVGAIWVEEGVGDRYIGVVEVSPALQAGNQTITERRNEKRITWNVFINHHSFKPRT